MIIYFTGTGNSRYAAKKIAEQIGDSVSDAVEKIREKKYGNYKSDLPYVFVCPTYAWRIPRIFEEWIRKSTFQGSKEAYFVMTCGSDIGNAGQYLEKLCEACGFVFRGVAEIVMPENYTAMFPVPDKAEADVIIAKADQVLEGVAENISARKCIEAPKHGVVGKITSGPVNPLFYGVCVKAKGFWAKDTCVGCGKCANLCPLHNIEIKDGKPVWGNQCTHCMACINACPVEAVEYKKASKGKPRYYLEG